MLDAERRFFAEDVRARAVANLRTPGLVDDVAAVPRERDTHCSPRRHEA
jgi:hypothetical protein